MESRYIIVTALLLGIILFFAGGALSENCIDLGGCKQCWKTTQTVVNDAQLCGGNSSCLAQPRDQQNNAIVDAVFCGCAKAKDGGYSNPGLNSKIEETIGIFSGFNLSVIEVCEQPGTFLAKVSYV